MLKASGGLVVTALLELTNPTIRESSVPVNCLRSLLNAIRVKVTLLNGKITES